MQSTCLRCQHYNQEYEWKHCTNCGNANPDNFDINSPHLNPATVLSQAPQKQAARRRLLYRLQALPGVPRARRVFLCKRPRVRGNE